MTAAHKHKRRTTPDLITFHKINAKRLRLTACEEARKILHTWLAKIVRRARAQNETK